MSVARLDLARARDDLSMCLGEGGSPRSAGTISERRELLSWPENREFRILSIDGGGIRGIFPAAFLAGLEERFLGGTSIADYFDLITGASTGGIIAIGLGAGLTAAQLRDLYIKRGSELFNPNRRALNNWLRWIAAPYESEVLAGIMQDILGDRLFGESQTRLCVPSFEGEYGEVYVFKTPHHPDFWKDWKEKMAKVAVATAAAPTYLRPIEDGGYTFVDGGVWANNPVMVGLVDALSCFDVRRDQVRILSMGCGNEPYKIGGLRRRFGGKLMWHDIIFAAMRLQSCSALGQAGLLIGKNRLIRVDAPNQEKPIALDDWERAVAELPDYALDALDKHGDAVFNDFLREPSVPFTPFYPDQ